VTDEADPSGASDAQDEDEAFAPQWPVKGPATPGQAILAIGFIFFLGVALGFVLCKLF